MEVVWCVRMTMMMLRNEATRVRMYGTIDIFSRNPEFEKHSRPNPKTEGI